MDLSKVSKKLPHEDSRMTLSAIDFKTMANFSKYYSSINDKKKLLIQLERKKSSSRSVYSNEYHELCKKICDLEIEIDNISNKTHQIDYLMKASTYFMEYSNNESKQEIQENINGFIVTKDKTNRGKICQDYIKECIGDGYSLSTKSSELEIANELTCDNCGLEKLTNPRESYASCPNCGETTRYQDTQNNKGEYSEEVEVLSPFAYKRINHFKEWLSSIMAREGTGPSPEVIDELLRELKKDKVETREEVTEERIRRYLKKLKYVKMYDNIPSIIYKLSGVPPPKISPQLESKLIEMFQQIQPLFEKHIPKNRKNFLSYAYCIYKLLELLGQNHLLHKLSLLKSRDKLHQQDIIWRKITKDMHWAYFKSL